MDDGTLNVVCGFMTIDEDSRTLVLEGTAGPHGGLTALLRRVSRVGPNGQTYRVLENPDVRFSRRLYSCFDADLKKVKRNSPASRWVIKYSGRLLLLIARIYNL